MVLDLCRASFVRTSDLADGDDAVKADPELFMAFAEANWKWTWQRLLKSQATRVVVCGLIAEHCFLRLLQNAGMSIQTADGLVRFRGSRQSLTGYASPMKLGDWLQRQVWWLVKREVKNMGRRQ